MKRTRTVSLSLTILVFLGLLASVLAAPGDDPPSHRAMDVVLHDGGIFVGQVVGPQGASKPGVSVRLRTQQRELVRFTTDQRGRFALKGLSSGSYQLVTKLGQVHVRAWAKDAAPPNVAAGALLVEGTTVRGQSTISTSGVSGAMANPNVASFNLGGVSSGAYGVPAGTTGLFGLGVLGQGGLLTSPFGVGAAGVATAIAIPVSILDDDDAS